MSSTGRPADIGPGSQGRLKGKTVKLVKSQAEALEAARSALADRQYQLTKEIQSLARQIDGYAKGQEVPTYLTESFANRKAQLADTFLSREALWDMEWNGMKEAPAAK
jgi:hypothetical protein